MNAASTAPSVAYDVRMFCGWFRSARAGDVCFYHAGNLALDRARDEDLANLADTVSLLNDGGAISLRQFRRHLPLADVWVYVAQRNQGGHAPAALISGKITSVDFRALRAVRDRDADISVTRAIRDAISASSISSDDLAASVFNSLRDRKLVEEAPGKGWQISRAGLKAMT